MHNIVEEITTLSKDFDRLRSAFREGDEDNRAVVLRMCAAKAEHVAVLFREMADALERGLKKVL
jgi:hypothetical protein